MINWLSVLFNSFWIFGLAIMLAAFSYNHWLAGQEGRRLRVQLNEPGFLRLFWLGVVLIGIGLATTSQLIWETAIWIVLTIIALALLINLFR